MRSSRPVLWHIQVYEKFREKYFKLNRRYGKDQYLVPYLISSHPGCTPRDVVLDQVGEKFPAGVLHQIVEADAGADEYLLYLGDGPELAQQQHVVGVVGYLVPYLISSHPGCTLEDAVQLAEWLNKQGHMPEQVQDFYPTPGTLATCMWYTGLDPRTMTFFTLGMARSLRSSSM